MTKTTNLCDCERGHNGIGLVGRECDCPAGQSDEFWHGWNAAFDNDPFEQDWSLDRKRGYGEARQSQANDNRELAS